jgi:hypothetical protein
VVIRLSGRGQYEVINDDSLLVELNKLDNKITALLAQTEGEMQALLAQMAGLVEQRGRLTGDIEPSDLILPPVELTLAEAAAIFAGEGLISDYACFRAETVKLE